MVASKSVNRLIDLAVACGDAASSSALADLLCPTLGLFGFGPIMVVRRLSRMGNPRDGILLSTFPAEWLRDYLQGGLWRVDPIVVDALRRGQPRRWSSPVPAGVPHARRAGEVLALAAAHGLVDGVIVPIFGLPGFVGMVTFASAMPQTDQPGVTWALMALAHAIFARLDALAETPGQRAPLVKLTNRERECLVWAAEGKSDHEIAAGLSISASTVHFHIENAKRKLGAQSRIQAILHAVQTGQFSI